MTAVVLFAALLAGHALCDYPLQGDWLATAKNHRMRPVAGETVWPGALAAHGLIHAAAVALITGSLTLGLCEFVAHCAVDYSKCDGRFGYNVDQALHVFCKAAWVLALLWMA